MSQTSQKSTKATLLTHIAALEQNEVLLIPRLFELKHELARWKQQATFLGGGSTTRWTESDPLPRHAKPHA